MLPFSTITPRTSGQASTFEVPDSRFYENAWDQGINDSALSSIFRGSELWLEKNDSALWGLIEWDNGNMLTKEEANARAKERGLPLQFDEDIYESAFMLMADRKRKELDRMFYMTQGEQSAGRFVGGMATQMLASIMNPLDFALMFVPIVGQAGKAKGLAMAGAGQFRRTLARGLVTTEQALAKRVAAPRLTAVAIEGTVGQAITEIPLFMANVQDQADYDFSDFGINILAGGVFATGLRVGLDGAAKLLNRVNATTKEISFKRAIDQFAKGEDIRIQEYIELDENILRRQAVFDEVEVRRQAKEQVGSIDEFKLAAFDELSDLQKLFVNRPLYHFTDIDPTIIKKQGFKPGETDNAVFFTTAKEGTHYGTMGDNVVAINNPAILRNLSLDDFDLVLTIGEIDKYSKYFSKKSQAKIAEAYKSAEGSDDLDIQFEARTELYKYLSENDEQGFVNMLTNEPDLLDEIPIKIKGSIKPQDVITASGQGITNRARQLRENAIKKYIRRQRKAFDPEKKFEELKAQEIARQQAEGKILPPDELQKYSSKERITEADITAIENDVATLEQELDIKSPEQAEDMSPAIQAATNCLIQNG